MLHRFNRARISAYSQPFSNGAQLSLAVVKNILRSDAQISLRWQLRTKVQDASVNAVPRGDARHRFVVLRMFGDGSRAMFLYGALRGYRVTSQM